LTNANGETASLARNYQTLSLRDTLHSITYPTLGKVLFFMQYKLNQLLINKHMSAPASIHEVATSAQEHHLRQAVQFHQAGNLQQAELLYRSILQTHPNHPDANHNMGVLAIQVKQIGASLPFFKTALSSNPDSPQYWISYIDALIQAQESSVAEQILALGRQQGLQGDGIDQLEKRLALLTKKPIEDKSPSPNTAQISPPAKPIANLPTEKKGQGGTPNPKAINKLLDLCNRGLSAEAVSLGSELTQRYPTHGISWKLLGIAIYQQGRFADALTPMQYAAKLLPNDADVHGNLGVLLLDLSRFKEAEESLRIAIKLKGNGPDARNNIGIALRELGCLGESEEQLLHALSLKPKFAEAHLNLGITLQQQMRYLDAEKSMRRALEIKPNFVKAYNNLALNLEAQNRYIEAEHYLEQALQLSPNFAQAHTNLGLVLLDQGKLNEAEKSLRRALELTPDAPVAYSNLLFSSNYHPDKSAEEIFASYQAFNAHLCLPHHAAWRPHTNSRETNRKLKIGYVSPDFNMHPVRHLLDPLLQNHDKNAFEVFAYAELRHEDAQTTRYKSLVNHWVNTTALTDVELADRIRADGIDILIDIAGHSANNRLGAFAFKPAPVSASWLGYGYTTGMTAIDYYMADENLLPIGSEHLFSEKPWRLPTPGYAFRPAEGMGSISPLPALENGFITFATLSRAIRINHRTIGVWAAILKRFKNAKLIINSRNYQTAAAQDQMALKFAEHGIERTQLDIGFESPPWDLMRKTDICLDCFPHNSGTTLAEHLYMGIPYITLADRPSVGLIGGGILIGVGHPEWIAKTEDEYVEIAVALASDLPKLAALRASLRGEMEASGQMDEPKFARKMESAYQEMFNIWSKKHP